MFEILSTLIDWVSSFLAWLSRWQVACAKARIRNLTHFVKETRDAQHRMNQRYEKTVNKAENEIERMQYFLDSDYKEL